jgi:D-alanyl-D-alanine carboxypeptidase/D-alanyl-D-alanine carboxypeptidase (penicillin-binding protein 5/6)
MIISDDISWISINIIGTVAEVDIRESEVVPREEELYDAANVIAYVLGGSVSGFVAQMNAKAKEIGLHNTSFATPSGLDNEKHYTTTLELAKLTQYALKNEKFAEVVATRKATLNYGNPPYKRSLTNHNKLLNMYDGAVGVKTGFTKKSGRCLVSAAKRDGEFIIAVTLNAPNDWSDHKAMLDYGFSAIQKTEFKPSVDCYSVPVINGEKEALEVKLDAFSVNSLGIESITCEVFLPKFVYAPINSGDTLGRVVYMQGSKLLAEKPLVAKTTVKALAVPQGMIYKIIDNFKHILKNL